MKKVRAQDAWVFNVLFGSSDWFSFFSVLPSITSMASPEAFCDEQTMQTHSSTEWLFEECWHFCRYSTENQFPIDPALFHAALPKRMLWSGWTAVPIGSRRGLRHLLGLSADVKDADVSVLFRFFNHFEAHILLDHTNLFYWSCCSSLLVVAVLKKSPCSH